MQNRTSYTVHVAEEGMGLLDFLAKHSSLPRRGAKELLNSRNVLVNRQRTWMARHPLKAGDIVEIQGAARETSSQAPAIAVAYRDEHYLIVNKRPGLLSNGPDSVEALLRRQLGVPTLKSAHRLDRDTSGCLLVAKTSEAFEAVIPVFRRHKIRKCYHVIILGRINPPDKTLRIPIEGVRAVTHLRTLDATRGVSHLFATIDTGRTHQIRRHLDAIHHPVLGDRQYGVRFAVTDDQMTAERQMLHAYSIDFVSPFTGRRVFAKIPLPPDFRRCLHRYHLT